ncbi:MAG: hypothetical protein JSV41_01380 [Gemmatimonadota bacterium]|nr:MAG: hypothetical protein JSV41_01380 [Gemmatimonadota bacterium]
MTALTSQAILIKHNGPPEVLVEREVPLCRPCPGLEVAGVVARVGAKRLSVRRRRLLTDG